MIVPYRQPPLADFAAPHTAHTLAGFRAWVAAIDLPEHVHVHLVGGEVFIQMSPERIFTHSLVKHEVSRVLGNLVLESGAGVAHPHGVWLTSDDAELSVEPDAFSVTWDSHRAGRAATPEGARNQAIERRGAPDWVLEVVSPSSVRKNSRLLPVADYRAGVKEFWLFGACGDELPFTVFVRGEKACVPAPAAAGWTASPVLGKEFRLERSVNPIGGWRYQRLVR